MSEYDDKLKREEQIRLGKLCEEWYEKIGKPFLEDETNKILRKLDTAHPEELLAVQERYKAITRLMKDVQFFVNKKNNVLKKMTKE